MQYNEQFHGEEHQGVLENPQPLAGLTHRQQELDLNVQGKSTLSKVTLQKLALGN